MAKDIIILAPVTGTVKELSKVKDFAFAGGMVGQGYAITPAADATEVVSPTAKGKISVAFEGGHAYGVTTKACDIIIHIGIETVMLKGEPFDQKVFTGDKVKTGTVLTGVDFKMVKEKADSTDTMVVVTNDTIGDHKVELVAGKTVIAGEPLFKLV